MLMINSDRCPVIVRSWLFPVGVSHFILSLHCMIRVLSLAYKMTTIIPNPYCLDCLFTVALCLLFNVYYVGFDIL